MVLANESGITQYLHLYPHHVHRGVGQVVVEVLATCQLALICAGLVEGADPFYYAGSRSRGCEILAIGIFASEQSRDEIIHLLEHAVGIFAYLYGVPHVIGSLVVDTQILYVRVGTCVQVVVLFFHIVLGHSLGHEYAWPHELQHMDLVWYDPVCDNLPVHLVDVVELVVISPHTGFYLEPIHETVVAYDLFEILTFVQFPYGFLGCVLTGFDLAGTSEV